MVIDKNAKEISLVQGDNEVVSLAEHPDFDIVSTTIGEQAVKLYKLKEGISSNTYNLKFVSNGSTLSVSIL